MSHTVITAEKFMERLGGPIAGDLFLKILELHNLTFDLFTSPSLTVEERIASQAKHPDYIAVVAKSTNSFTPGNSNNPNPILLCCVIYINDENKLFDMIDRSIKMKAFL